MSLQYSAIPGRGPRFGNPESRSKVCIRIWIADRRFAAFGMTKRVPA